MLKIAIFCLLSKTRTEIYLAFDDLRNLYDWRFIKNIIQNCRLKLVMNIGIKQYGKLAAVATSKTKIIRSDAKFSHVLKKLKTYNYRKISQHKSN